MQNSAVNCVAVNNIAINCGVTQFYTMMCSSVQIEAVRDIEGSNNIMALISDFRILIPQRHGEGHFNNCLFIVES